MISSCDDEKQILSPEPLVPTFYDREVCSDLEQTALLDAALFD